jgi:hypothetical protein
MVESSSTSVSPISPSRVGPREVVESFLRLTVDRPDLQKARLHLSRRSVDSGVMAVTSMPPGTRYTLGAQMADELGHWIPVNVKSPVPSAGLQEMTVPVVVVQEEGEWKIDLPATMERLLGKATGAMGQALSAVGDVMAKAMDTVLTTFGSATAAGAAPPAQAAPPSPAPAAVKVPVRSAALQPAAKKSVIKKPAVKAAKKPLKKAAKRPAKKKPAAKPAKKAARKSTTKAARKSRRQTRRTPSR